MKLKCFLRPLAVAALTWGCAASHAALYDAPVPTNAYITVGGFDWAWANAVAADGSFVDTIVRPGSYTGIDLSYQSQFGWRLPTQEELAIAPLATAFLFAGANVPGSGPMVTVDPVTGAYGPGISIYVDPVSGARNTTPGRNGADMACAAPYFSAWALTCNYANGPGTNVPGQYSTPWWGAPGSQSFSDSLVVRVAAPVPEPETWLLMVVGLGVLAGLRRRKV
jgi:PEP-CTERM motif